MRCDLSCPPRDCMGWLIRDYPWMGPSPNYKYPHPIKMKSLFKYPRDCGNTYIGCVCECSSSVIYVTVWLNDLYF